MNFNPQMFNLNPFMNPFDPSQKEGMPLPMVGPPGMKKNYKSEDCINIIFEEGTAVNKYLGIPRIIIKCSMKDKISTLIEKYKEKTGDPVTAKIFMFGNNQLIPDLTVEQSKLYMNCIVKVISIIEENHWSNI